MRNGQHRERFARVDRRCGVSRAERIMRKIDNVFGK